MNAPTPVGEVLLLLLLLLPRAEVLRPILRH